MRLLFFFLLVFFSLQGISGQALTTSEVMASDSLPKITEPPRFSSPGGFYREGFDLHLSHPDPDVTIIYTLDGSEPEIDNLEGRSYRYKNSYAYYPDSPIGEFLEKEFHSLTYTEAIPITDRSAENDKLTHISTTVQKPDYFPASPVYKGTVVRARAFMEGYLPGEIKTHTYFVTSSEGDRFSLPVISIAIGEDKLFDYDKGIYTPGADADRWRENNPDQRFRWPYPGNFHRRGDAWEYEGNFEYFGKGSKICAVNRLLGIRIHGGGSRSFPMKSLRLYARSKYGESELNYPFFENNPFSRFKRLILRNSGNDFPTYNWQPDYTSRTMLRDAAIQAVAGHLNFDTQDYSPAVLFLNGEYWGIHNIRERYDRHYLERVHGVDPLNIDLLTGHGTVKEGDKLHYYETYNYVRDNDMEDDLHYSHILTRIDPESFTDYQITNIFVRNTDWPGNNIDYWRVRTNEYEPDNPPGHDGRWRWLLYDTDFGFGLWGGITAYRHNTLEFATREGLNEWPNPDYSTLMLRNLLRNKNFRDQFINRFADLLNTAFDQGYVESVINRVQLGIAGEIEEHFFRWFDQVSFGEWEENVDAMKEFARKRPSYQRNHILDYFDLKGLAGVTLDVSHPRHGHIKINTVHIAPSTPGVDPEPYPWEGIYFKEIPMEISAVPAPGYWFSHWEGSYSGTDSILKIMPGEVTRLKAIFVATGHELLLHYWLFDENLPNNRPLEKIDATYSIAGNTPEGGSNPRPYIEFRTGLPDYPYHEDHPLWRTGSMERRNSPTLLNYRDYANNDLPFEEAGMRGLQIREPLIYNGTESALVFHLPSKGAKDLIFRFAAKDEGAADRLLVDYSLDDTDNWSQENLKQGVIHVSDSWELYKVDLTEIKGAVNNDLFRIRLRFRGPAGEVWDGNRITFNNFSLDGVVCLSYRVQTIPSEHGIIEPEGVISVYQCGKQEFIIIPDPAFGIKDLLLNGKSVFNEVIINEDRTGSYLLPGQTGDSEIFAVFSLYPIRVDDDGLVVYPNPTSDRLYFQALLEIRTIGLYDMAGKKQYEKKVNGNMGEIDVNHLPPGLYLIRFKAEKGVFSRRIMLAGSRR